MKQIVSAADARQASDAGLLHIVLATSLALAVMTMGAAFAVF